MEKPMPDWTVILSAPDDLALAGRLAESHGLDVLAVPDIYHLPDGHAALSAIGERTGPLVVAAPYYPRATYWTLAAKGLTGRRADSDQTKTTGRAVYPIDVTDLDADGAAEKILAVTANAPPPTGGGGVTDLRETLGERWHPVIDFDRCVHCYECVEFCLFGVYEVTPAERVFAAVPDNCKPGCPACARVCPTAAIIFPRYGGRGPIAGDDEDRPESAKGDAARQAAAGDIKAYHQDHRAASAASTTKKPDPVEGLLDDLDAFEA